ncbi:transcription factor bHLH111 isoform X1 [Brassica rapa]|uniref:transcription factor bHLH111 isoform X1 n=1 Tax=Brassica campestris TaxID=3711 RepID=UPI0004F1CD04|nr:transcription factor bHLH111 isoform X1 [Brassica rapa]
MIREECTPSSSWWEDVHHDDHASSISTSFYHKNSNGNNNNNSNANCEGDNLSISTVNTSNRFDLTAESSSRHSLSAPDHPASTSDELLRDHVVSSNNHLWSLAYLPGRSLGDQMLDHHHHNNHITSSRNNSSTTSELPFEPVCDNANGWIYDTNQVRYNQSSDQRLSKLTDLVGKHWSLAPPSNPDMNHNLHHHFDQTSDDISMYRQELEVKNEEDLCYNNELNGGASLFRDAIESSRSFLDIRLSRPLTDINPSFKPSFKALSLSEFGKKEHQTASLLFSQATVRLGSTNAGKKKRCDEVSDEASKKAKCGRDSTHSPDKDLPKAKLRDKITTLQQIVSPFGKTDTASVLQEAITYINFYQEQVKLLSTPYMKNSSIKDPWGGWDREEHNKRGPKHLDLKSRGLCLVPISCTPVAYHDNSATDYWSPSYRGSLYR